ncbi:non-ribosomal peptide synthetase [Clostridium botulinum]|uniref:non-ribosomal peptide synthetase n=1 Tax=Clostridium botulinum TaxID=1491 RepID=UPI0019672D8D|nr:non-ribosomal peptide synthetase [Clostridium botulinum]MBN1050271.1 amino acid adenylation domain-containing protein [Clostridium botulinum]
MEIKKIYPLSPMQKGMLFHKLMDNNDSSYFEQTIFEIEGKIDIELFKKAYNLLIDKYDVLRTIFDYKTFDQPMQIVKNKIYSKIYYKDLSTLSEIDKNLAIKNIRDKDRERGFNLFRESLMRVFILKLDDVNHQLIWSHHHILMDGWCTILIISDLLNIYSALKNDKEIVKTKVPEYETFINWIEKQDENEALNYWQSYIKDYEKEVTVPTKINNSNCENKGKETFRFNIPKDKINELTEICNKSKVTMNTIFQCIWGIILQKYNNSNDIVFGSVSSGRNANVSGIEEMVGLFINTVPIRVKNTEDTTFSQLIKQIQSETLETSKYDYYPLYEIQSKSILKNKLINNIMVFENYFSEDIKSQIDDVDLFIKKVIINEETNYDLDIIIVPGEIYTIKVNYNTNLYEIDFIKNIESAFIKIVNIITDNFNIKIKDIDILSDNEKNRILNEFNDTNIEYPKNKTIQELFEEQVEKTPDNIAVIFEDKKLTYKVLNEKANSLARILRNKGVKADSIVGIMVDRSLEMIIGIMGILKAGGAYLPIDPKYPKNRIEYILKDSGTKMLLSKFGLVETLEFDGTVLDLFGEDLFNGCLNNLEKINNSENLIYVIYTSGTTGNPKGVMVEHRNVNNFINGIVNDIKINEYSNILCITTIGFDIFGLETLVPLTNGMKVIITDDDIGIIPTSVSEIIVNNRIEVVQSTPSRLRMLMGNKEFTECLHRLKVILIGGEAMSPDLLSKLKNYKNLKVYNMYGPTETTIWSTVKRIDSEEYITIGKPIQNAKIFILNKDMKLQPIGVVGELCIGGDGVARGYLNNEQLTNEKFVNNPYENGGVIYKTGDLARWLPDGNIQCLGRADDQVKIRGYRIELGDIENTFLKIKGINKVAVIVREINNDKSLYAYYVGDIEYTVEDLRMNLANYIPVYMIPSYFIKVDEIPLNSNGKIDKKCLMDKKITLKMESNYEASRNKLEEKLVKIWNEVLGIEKIGINDNFFDLGGHSLKAMTLISKIHKETNKEVPLKELFKYPTIKGISKFIESAEESIYSKIEEIEEKEYYEASSAQKRMYVIQGFDKDSIAYNMPQVFEVKGSMNNSKIEDIFRKLVERHEALRTYFETIENEIVQKIDRNYKFNLNNILESKPIEEVINNFIKPFELGKAPLFRAEIVEIQDKNYLLIDMHHIISDGVSMSILINEFATLYNGGYLEQLKLQYKDFAAWQNNFLSSEEVKKQEEYWINMFNDEIPVLNLPYDYERTDNQSFEGDSINFQIDKDLTYDLKHFTKKTGTTVHMVLLSAFYILLSKYSGQEDIVVGIPIAGRPHVDLQNIIGMFVNTLALRNRPKGNKKYIDFLNEVKESSLKSYENQNYQIEKLVENLNIKRNPSRNPLFDVMFNTLNVEVNDIDLNEILLEPYYEGNEVSKVDLDLSLVEGRDTLNLRLVYCNKLFDHNTIEIIRDDFIDILQIISKDENILLANIINNRPEEDLQDLIELDDNFILD